MVVIEIAHSSICLLPTFKVLFHSVLKCFLEKVLLQLVWTSLLLSHFL